ncbi:type II toxin-antitoxin system RelE/ParE family toxin [Hornefia butyriciproducens]|uniref:type II toxin-antitoxin system RelE/ParE family toxin n=1 Tax=Hornefia butyriciproducens TaxID=2652293 RepID=UPI003F88D86A
MTHYKTHITDEALNDMESIYEYIAEELLAPDTAMGQYNRIADAIGPLDQMPERIKLMESEPERTRGLRGLIVDNYAVFFIIADDVVIVTNVLYGASDIENRLRGN